MFYQARADGHNFNDGEFNSLNRKERERLIRAVPSIFLTSNHHSFRHLSRLKIHPPLSIPRYAYGSSINTPPNTAALRLPDQMEQVPNKRFPEAASPSVRFSTFLPSRLFPFLFFTAFTVFLPSAAFILSMFACFKIRHAYFCFLLVSSRRQSPIHTPSHGSRQTLGSS